MKTTASDFSNKTCFLNMNIHKIFTDTPTHTRQHRNILRYLWTFPCKRFKKLIKLTASVKINSKN